MNTATESRVRDLLRELCMVGAASGHEDRLIAAVLSRLEARGLAPEVDRLGQISVTFAGTNPDAPSVMLSAHLDQLGLVVSTLDAEGFIRFERLGGIPERVLPGTRVMVQTRKGDVPGVIGLKAHHLTPAEDKYVALPTAKLYIDIGCDSAEAAAELGVQVGDPCVYAPSWTELSGGRVATTSLDDRLGVVALLELIDRCVERPPGGTVHVAFTTQEEFHVRGTLSLVQKLVPDIVVNVDVAPASDAPDLRGATAVALGAGPVINRLSFHGRGTLGGLIPHPALLDAVERAAEVACDHYQYEVIVGLINDAAFVPMATGEGIAAVGVAIPTRYTHSPVETAQISDLLQTIDLLEAIPGACETISLERPFVRP